MAILTQFIFRLSFGMALGMALTNPRQVTSGYYRNHLYVLLGLNVLATMVAFSNRDQFVLAPPLLAAVLSYVGAVAWLYEKPRAGIVLLALVSAVSLWGAWAGTTWPAGANLGTSLLIGLDPLTSGLVLGITMAAMFLGHWYLNTPTMVIAPLLRLVVLMGLAVILRGAIEAVVVTDYWRAAGLTTEQLIFLSLRWLSGIFGMLGLTIMAYKTLQIPNTQAATGILYVGVIASFLGELTALLLSVQSAGVV